MGHDRLSPQDVTFLYFEDAGAAMHVGSVLLFKGEPPTVEEFRDHIASRLPLVPRFRQKLAKVPFDQGRPVWVDDPHLNLEYHVRAAAIPPPGSEDQLRTMAGRIFSQRLDRHKPLWEIWLIQNLEGGRFALVGKSHHCLVDGVSGVDITTVLFDIDPQPSSQPPSKDRWQPAPEPTGSELLADALIERAVNPGEVVRGVRHLFRAPRHVAGRVTDALTAVGAFAWAGLTPAPPTPLNVDVGPHRRVVWIRGDLTTLKRIKDVLGGTVNDVILAVAAGAMRRFLIRRRVRVGSLELKTMVPVSVRTTDESGALGNRVAAMMAMLPVYASDPLDRLRIVSENMAGLKDSKQAVGADVLMRLTGFAGPTVLAQAARLQAKQRLFNLYVTNVPGPQFPLYLLGREMVDLFPFAPLVQTQALAFAIMSYNGRINFALIGDLDAMWDLDDLGDDVREAIEELADAADRHEPAQPARAV